MPSFVVIRQQIKEKRRGHSPPPPQPIWFQNTPAWIGLNSQSSLDRHDRRNCHHRGDEKFDCTIATILTIHGFHMIVAIAAVLNCFFFQLVECIKPDDGYSVFHFRCY